MAGSQVQANVPGSYQTAPLQPPQPQQPQQQFRCRNDCGFQGDFAAVSAHEAVCKRAAAAQEMER